MSTAPTIHQRQIVSSNTASIPVALAPAAPAAPTPYPSDDPSDKNIFQTIFDVASDATIHQINKNGYEKKRVDRDKVLKAIEAKEQEKDKSSFSNNILDHETAKLITDYKEKHKDDEDPYCTDSNKESSSFGFVIMIVNLLIVFMIMISYVIMILIFLVSLLNVFTIIAYYFSDVLKSFLNEQFIFYNTNIYNYFNFTDCNEIIYDKDPLLIYLNQYLNIALFYDYYIIFQVCLLFVILIIICGIIDLLKSRNSITYTKILSICELQNKFETGNLIIIFILLIYSIINFALYKYYFISRIHSNYVKYLLSYQEFDNEIYDMLFTKEDDNNHAYNFSYYELVKKNDIKEINLKIESILNDTTKTESNKINDIVKYLHIYNFYNYFYDNIPFSVSKYNEAVNSYLTCGKDDDNVTFISLLSYQEKILMTKKFINFDFFININEPLPTTPTPTTDATTNHEKKQELGAKILEKIDDDLHKINKFIADANSPDSELIHVLVFTFLTLFINVLFICIIIYCTGSGIDSSMNINTYLKQLGEFCYRNIFK